LRFNFVVAAHPLSALHSSVFARLASGAFYETIVPPTFYEMIIIDGFVKSRGTLRVPDIGREASRSYNRNQRVKSTDSGFRPNGAIGIIKSFSGPLIYFSCKNTVKTLLHSPLL
jgi:hypothetical protein